MADYKQKIFEAENVIRACVGVNGVWAGANRYKYQCWTRDFIVSLPTLLDLGYARIARRHLARLLKKQNSDGEIPILFADSFLKLFFKKGRDFIKKRKASFVFKKMIWPGLSKLSPGTRDVDTFFVLGVQEYSETTGDDSLREAYKNCIGSAVRYIENKLLDRNGFLRGADWRDLLEKELEDKTLLSNNAILYRMYFKLGNMEKAMDLKNKINSLFWNGRYYRDYPETEEFDVYGQSLAILFDIVPVERNALIARQYKEISMPLGFIIKNILPKPTSKAEEKSVQNIAKNFNRLGVVWPYINAFAILALLKIGEKDLAYQMFDRWNNLEGFYEWYDPETGEGFGDDKQLWSAALYLMVAKKFTNEYGKK